MLNTSTAAGTNNANLTQDTYVQNTSYRDEWILERMNPTNGSELPYDTSLWNYSPVVKNTNCYAYALNNQVHPNTNNLWYIQPGESAGYSITSSHLTKYWLEYLVSKDAAELGFTFEEIGKYEKCPAGSYKVALFVAPGIDYHWYRQNSDGTWSHKLASNSMTNKDADNKIIIDPELSNRTYSSADYTRLIGYYRITPLNNYYVSTKSSVATYSYREIIEFDESKNIFPNRSVLQNIRKGMSYASMTELLGKPQRMVTFGLIVVEYDLDNSDALRVEYTRSAEGSLIVEKFQYITHPSDYYGENTI